MKHAEAKEFSEFSRNNFLTLQFQGSLLKPMLISAETFLKQQCDQHISTSSGYCMCADVLQMCANSNKLFTTIRLHNVQLVSAIRLRWMSNNKIKRPTEIKITSLDSIKVLGIIV